MGLLKAPMDPLAYKYLIGSNYLVRRCNVKANLSDIPIDPHNPAEDYQCKLQYQSRGKVSRLTVRHKHGD